MPGGGAANAGGEQMQPVNYAQAPPVSDDKLAKLPGEYWPRPAAAPTPTLGTSSEQDAALDPRLLAQAVALPRHTYPHTSMRPPTQPFPPSPYLPRLAPAGLPAIPEVPFPESRLDESGRRASRPKGLRASCAVGALVVLVAACREDSYARKKASRPSSPASNRRSSLKHSPRVYRGEAQTAEPQNTVLDSVRGFFASMFAPKDEGRVAGLAARVDGLHNEVSDEMADLRAAVLRLAASGNNNSNGNSNNNHNNNNNNNNNDDGTGFRPLGGELGEASLAGDSMADAASAFTPAAYGTPRRGGPGSPSPRGGTPGSFSSLELASPRSDSPDSGDVRPVYSPSTSGRPRQYLKWRASGITNALHDPVFSPTDDDASVVYHTPTLHPAAKDPLSPPQNASDRGNKAPRQQRQQQQQPPAATVSPVPTDPRPPPVAAAAAAAVGGPEAGEEPRGRGAVSVVVVNDAAPVFADPPVERGAGADTDRSVSPHRKPCGSPAVVPVVLLPPPRHPRWGLLRWAEAWRSPVFGEPYGGPGFAWGCSETRDADGVGGSPPAAAAAGATTTGGGGGGTRPHPIVVRQPPGFDKGAGPLATTATTTTTTTGLKSASAPELSDAHEPKTALDGRRESASQQMQPQRSRQQSAGGSYGGTPPLSAEARSDGGVPQHLSGHLFRGRSSSRSRSAEGRGSQAGSSRRPSAELPVHGRRGSKSPDRRLFWLHTGRALAAPGASQATEPFEAAEFVDSAASRALPATACLSKPAAAPSPRSGPSPQCSGSCLAPGHSRRHSRGGRETPPVDFATDASQAADQQNRQLVSYPSLIASGGDPTEPPGGTFGSRNDLIAPRASTAWSTPLRAEFVSGGGADVRGRTSQVDSSSVTSQTLPVHRGANPEQAAQRGEGVPFEGRRSLWDRPSLRISTPAAGPVEVSIIAPTTVQSSGTRQSRSPPVGDAFSAHSLLSVDSGRLRCDETVASTVRHSTPVAPRRLDATRGPLLQWRCDGVTLSADDSGFGVLEGAFAYLVCVWDGDAGVELFLWHGSLSNDAQQQRVASKAAEIDGTAHSTTWHVADEDHEPTRMLKLLLQHNRRLVIRTTPSDHLPHALEVRRVADVYIKLVEISDPSTVAWHLVPSGVVLLVTRAAAYVWQGSSCSVWKRTAALQHAAACHGAKDLRLVEEGADLPAFHAAFPPVTGGPPAPCCGDATLEAFGAPKAAFLQWKKAGWRAIEVSGKARVPINKPVAVVTGGATHVLLPTAVDKLGVLRDGVPRDQPRNPVTILRHSQATLRNALLDSISY
ncbi:hypothetical protein DIPPA_31479 [Diplonema papillatum]|nr:hypothetical protein DIPPA_31479 [Diplonema papillatum]